MNASFARIVLSVLFFLFYSNKRTPPSAPATAPFSLFFVYEKSNTPTLKNAQPATPDGSSRLSYPEKLRAPTGVEYTKGSSAGLSDVLSDVSSAYGLRVGHFSFIVSRTDFRMCELTKNTKYSNLNHEKGME